MISKMRLSFHLSQGLDDDSVFLDERGIPHGVSGLFEELQEEPDSFDSQVIQPCALGCQQSALSCLETLH